MTWNARKNAQMIKIQYNYLKIKHSLRRNLYMQVIFFKLKQQRDL